MSGALWRAVSDRDRPLIIVRSVMLRARRPVGAVHRSLAAEPHQVEPKLMRYLACDGMLQMATELAAPPA